MTDKPDTSGKAVKNFALWLGANPMETAAAELLRALLAERDNLREQRDRLYDNYGEALAERDAARSEAARLTNRWHERHPAQELYLGLCDAGISAKTALELMRAPGIYPDFTPPTQAMEE